MLGRSVALVLCATLAVCLCGCEPAITRSVEAVVLATEGNVSSTSSSSAPALDVAAGAHAATGASLLTGADSQVALSLVPGARINLEAQSELRLALVKITKNGNRVQEAMEREVKLILKNGAFVASVQFESDGPGVSIDTPSGNVSTRQPALFRVEVRNQITRVTCARGSVFFQPQGETTRVSLQAPEAREWPVQEREAIPADFDVRALEEIENSKEVEQKLLGLEQRRRLSPFPWRQ